MASTICLKRLRKDYSDIQKNPPLGIRAAPQEDNILIWNYVLEGAKGTAYEGGWYHGQLTFPKEYPMKPPSIMMITPSGRFEPNKKLCLSMSDFHPESWNPLWNVKTILLGLSSFMVEDAITFGSIRSTTSQKKLHAEASLSFNVKNNQFTTSFPELVELHKTLQAAKPKTETDTVRVKSSSNDMTVMMMAVAAIVAILGTSVHIFSRFFL